MCFSGPAFWWSAKRLVPAKCNQSMSQISRVGLYVHLLIYLFLNIFFKPVCSWKTVLLVAKRGESCICLCWKKCLSYSLLSCNKNSSEMDRFVTLLSRYRESCLLYGTHFTDLWFDCRYWAHPVISLGVLTNVPAVVQWSSSSGMEQWAWVPNRADDPAGSYGHHTWTG